MQVLTRPPAHAAAERRAARAPPRPRTVRRSLAAAVLTLLLAALLNAETIDATAHAQAFGWRRDAATAISGPLLEMSDALGLTWPRHALEDLFDRPSSRRSAPGGTFPTTTVPSTTVTTAPEQPSTSAPTTQPPTTVPEHRRPSAADPLRVWIAGDSMTEAMGPALVDALEASGVVTARHLLTYSSGLTRPDYFDWYATSTAEIAASDPEVIVVMVGANDAQGIETAVGPAAFGTEAWIAEYRGRVSVLMDLLAADGRVVLWVGQPIMRSATFSARMALLDGIYQSEAAKRPDGVTFIDTRPILAGPDGGYAAYLPGESGESVLVRRSDGIHLTPAGAARVVAVIVQRLSETFQIEELGR